MRDYRFIVLQYLIGFYCNLDPEHADIQNKLTIDSVLIDKNQTTVVNFLLKVIGSISFNIVKNLGSQKETY